MTPDLERDTMTAEQQQETITPQGRNWGVYALFSSILAAMSLILSVLIVVAFDLSYLGLASFFFYVSVGSILTTIAFFVMSLIKKRSRIIATISVVIAITFMALMGVTGAMLL